MTDKVLTETLPVLRLGLEYADYCLKTAWSVYQEDEPAIRADCPAPERNVAGDYIRTAVVAAYDAVRSYCWVYEGWTASSSDYTPVYERLMATAVDVSGNNPEFMQKLYDRMVGYFFDKDALMLGRRRLYGIEYESIQEGRPVDKISDTLKADYDMEEKQHFPQTLVRLYGVFPETPAVSSLVSAVWTLKGWHDVPVDWYACPPMNVSDIPAGSAMYSATSLALPCDGDGFRLDNWKIERMTDL